MGGMKHPLRAWLKSRDISVTAFCEGRPFSYPTVYKLLKGEGTFSVDTLIEIAAATDDDVSVSTLVDTLREQRQGAQSEAA